MPKHQISELLDNLQSKEAYIRSDGIKKIIKEKINDEHLILVLKKIIENDPNQAIRNFARAALDVFGIEHSDVEPDIQISKVTEKMGIERKDSEVASSELQMEWDYSQMKKIVTVAFFVMVFVLALSYFEAYIPKKITFNLPADDTGPYGYDRWGHIVHPGAEVTINLYNRGSIRHGFTLEKKGQHIEPPFGDKDKNKIFWELDGGVDPGKEKSFTFTAPTEPGYYDIICRIPGHLHNRGVVGYLEVRIWWRYIFIFDFF